MNPWQMTVAELAAKLGGQVEGDGTAVVAGLNSLNAAGPGEITFVQDARRAGQLAATRAAAAIVPQGIPPAAIPLIRVANVAEAVGKLLGLVGEPEDLPPAGVHPSAVVSPDARLGAGVAVGPLAVVAAGAVIGDGAVLCAHVSVGAGVTVGAGTILFEGTVVQGHCRIGRSCRIGPNAVIGSSGFGYNFTGGRHVRVPHTGTVEIGDEVDIGACACVDRAKFGATRIANGAKIDNLVQIAHNVQVGPACVFAAQVGIAGSAVLKPGVVLGGHVGVRDNVTVGAGVRTGACSAIAQDVPDGATVAGIPAIDARLWVRAMQALTRLPELRQQVRQLEERLKALESPPADH